MKIVLLLLLVAATHKVKASGTTGMSDYGFMPDDPISNDVSRGDQVSPEYYGGYRTGTDGAYGSDGADSTDNCTDGVNEQLHAYDSELCALFGCETLAQNDVFKRLEDSHNYWDYARVKYHVEAAQLEAKKNRGEGTENIGEVLNILDEVMDCKKASAKQHTLTARLITEGVALSEVVSVNETIHMITYLHDAKGLKKACVDYADCLVTIWMKIVTDRDDSQIARHMRTLANIIVAMQSSSRYEEEEEDRAKILTLLSRKVNRIFIMKSLGGIQQLQDLLTLSIICPPTSLESIERVMSNISECSMNVDSPDDMQTFVDLQKDLMSISSSLVRRAKPGTIGAIRKITGTDVGKVILSSYIEMANKAMSPEKAKVWAKMTIEDATEQLHKMLLSNEEYVGDLSTIVMQTGNEKNYTIDKETVTVSLSKLKLKDNTSHAEFQYEDTLIKTDGLDTLSPSAGDDLRVYALRYKSWTEIVEGVLEQHMTSLDSDAVDTVSSRRRRAVQALQLNNSRNKSFIGKGGVVSLSTRQDGVRQSIPVKYWIAFGSAKNNSPSPLYQCLSCEYLDPVTLTWRHEGCSVSQVDDHGITCECNHTTNFAAFVMPGEAQYEVTETMERTFAMLSFIGSTISVIGLVMSLIVFYLVRHLVRNERLKAHTHLSIALLSLHLLFLMGRLFIYDTGLCTATAVLSHYFLLSAFFWMLIEGIFLYLYVVQVFLRSQISSYSWMYFVGWGIPFVIVAFSAGFGIHYDVYIDRAEDSREKEVCPAGSYAYKTGPSYANCWLSSSTGMIWSFLGPAIAIIIFNTVIMCRTLKICVESMRNSANMKSRTSSVSSAKYNSSTHDKSFDSARSCDSYNHLHGQATSGGGYAVSPSPCLLQVTTEEEQCEQYNPGSEHSVYVTPSTPSEPAKDFKEIELQFDSDQPRFHSVSGDSARFYNNRTQSVVYRSSISQSPNLKVKQSLGNKMAHLADKAQFLQDAKAAVKGAIVLLPILGIPWICGFFSQYSPVFTYLFIILNSTQGIFIFIVYGVKNGEVRRAIQRRLHTRSLKNSVDAGIRRSSSASAARSFLRIGRRRSTVLTTT